MSTSKVNPPDIADKHLAKPSAMPRARPAPSHETRPSTPKLMMDVQYASELSELPAAASFRKWARRALRIDSEIALRIVDEAEGRALNLAYRGRDYATNVLTFPLSEEPHLMGDIILCAPVVALEAVKQNKPLAAHYAHLTVHGVLHLHGYDHEKEAEAELMEALETEIITKLGYANPYEE